MNFAQSKSLPRSLIIHSVDNHDELQRQASNKINIGSRSKLKLLPIMRTIYSAVVYLGWDMIWCGRNSNEMAQCKSRSARRTRAAYQPRGGWRAWPHFSVVESSRGLVSQEICIAGYYFRVMPPPSPWHYVKIQIREFGAELFEKFFHVRRKSHLTPFGRSKRSKRSPWLYNSTIRRSFRLDTTILRDYNSDSNLVETGIVVSTSSELLPRHADRRDATLCINPACDCAAPLTYTTLWESDWRTRRELIMIMNTPGAISRAALRSRSRDTCFVNCRTTPSERSSCSFALRKSKSAPSEKRGVPRETAA